MQGKTAQCPVCGQSPAGVLQGQRGKAELILVSSLLSPRSPSLLPEAAGRESGLCLLPCHLYALDPSQGDPSPHLQLPGEPSDPAGVEIRPRGLALGAFDLIRGSSSRSGLTNSKPRFPRQVGSNPEQMRRSSLLAPRPLAVSRGRGRAVSAAARAGPLGRSPPQPPHLAPYL